MEVGLRLGLALALALALNYNANVSPLSGDWRPRPKVKCNSTAQQGLRCACLITFHSSFELREKRRNTNTRHTNLSSHRHYLMSCQQVANRLCQPSQAENHRLRVELQLQVQLGAPSSISDPDADSAESAPQTEANSQVPQSVSQAAYARTQTKAKAKVKAQSKTQTQTQTPFPNPNPRPRPRKAPGSRWKIIGNILIESIKFSAVSERSHLH